MSERAALIDGSVSETLIKEKRGVRESGRPSTTPTPFLCVCADASDCVKKASPSDPASADSKTDLGG